MEKQTYRLPKTKVGERSFKKIIRAGRVLFGKDGFQSTSINDIIAKAKVAAGTFYIYFDNKLALYMYLLDEYRIKIRNASSEATKGLTNRHDIEKAGLKAFIMYAKKDSLAYKIIWESLFVDYEIFKDYYKTFGESYLYHLKESVKTGELRDDIDLLTVAYVLMGISNFVGLEILFNDDSTEADVDRVVDETMKILRNGMFK